MKTLQLAGQLNPRASCMAAACPIARTMDVVGTWSAFLLLREAFYGTTRFDDFAERVGISQPVAAARLRELVADGLLAREPYREPGQRTRMQYRLTEKGAELFPVLAALMQWGDRWLGPARSSCATGTAVRRSAPSCPVRRASAGSRGHRAGGAPPRPGLAGEISSSAPGTAYHPASGPSIRRPALGAAQAAFVIGMAYAAISVYWGLGGSWLLDTVRAAGRRGAPAARPPCSLRSGPLPC